MIQYFHYAPVACIIFAITIVATLLAFYNEDLYMKLMLHPYSIHRGSKFYTIITSGFIHRDWGHLFFNMISFYFFAFQLEATIGHWQFGLLYFVSLILSDLPSIQKHKNDLWYHSLGASGAISAVIFSFIMFNPLAGMYLFFIPIAIPAIIFGVLYLVYCWYSSKNARDNINHDAHLFGAISGVVITIVLVPGIVPVFLRQLGVG